MMYTPAAGGRRSGRTTPVSRAGSSRSRRKNKQGRASASPPSREVRRWFKVTRPLGSAGLKIPLWVRADKLTAKERQELQLGQSQSQDKSGERASGSSVSRKMQAPDLTTAVSGSAAAVGLPEITPTPAAVPEPSISNQHGTTTTMNESLTKIPDIGTPQVYATTAQSVTVTNVAG